MNESRTAMRIGELLIDDTSLTAACERLLSNGRPHSAHLCNAYTVSMAHQDRGFANLINRGGMNLADGAPLAWIARWLEMPNLKQRVYGPALMALTLDRGREAGLKHYLYGSTPEVLAKLQASIEVRYPGVALVGAEAPPFGGLDALGLEAASSRFKESGADLVWVGLGTPLQDRVVEALEVTHGCTYVAIGAAFDFIAGTKRQAPVWIQRLGLEWLFRLCSEPRRLWRRYLVGNTVFLIAISSRRGRPRRAIRNTGPQHSTDGAS